MSDCQKVAPSDFPNFLFTAQPTAIGDVVNMLEAIDAALPEDDGVFWWNRLYLITTRELYAQADWEDAAWVSHLDVNFAQRYFEALKQLYAGEKVTTRAWRALFAARRRVEVDHIQFAFAGMTAHIAFDLALALATTNEDLQIVPSKDSAHWRDYQKVNDAFKVLIPKALAYLDSGIWGTAATATGLPGRLLAHWDIKQARDLAWDFADHLRALKADHHSLRAELAIEAQNRAVGAAATALLLPLDPTQARPGKGRLSKLIPRVCLAIVSFPAKLGRVLSR